MAVAVYGIPFDAYSSFLRGPALAPSRIRETLYSSSGNWCTESGFDLSQDGLWRDAGDAAVSVEYDPLGAIQRAAESILADGESLLSLGGDHSVSFPLVAAHASQRGPVGIVHLDAHGDLYDSLDGNRFSHATPFARIMEGGHASRLFQAGIRALTSHQRRQAAHFGVDMMEMRFFDTDKCLARIAELFPPTDYPSGVYLSLDLDVLDPAFAPGVSHHEPGGLSTRQLLKMIADFPVPILGADIVELNPLRDLSGTTAMVAAKLLKELLEAMSIAA